MIYLDHGATSFPKPAQVQRAVLTALKTCANPGRGGYDQAMQAAATVYRCRENAARLFGCQPEQVIMTSGCTHGLNIALASLVRPGSRVAISGFEHNAVVRPLHALGARVTVAGRKLFDWEDTLNAFHRALREGVDAVVCTHVSNVFGYILPVEELAEMCAGKRVPFVLDAAQSAGSLPVRMDRLGAAYIAMPGHKGLLGPQGTGLLLCAQPGKPLVYGGTGSASRDREMPEYLPDRLEAGTLNVSGIAGLAAGLQYVAGEGTEAIFRREHRCMRRCAAGLKKLGMRVFEGPHQAATVAFLPGMDCEEAAAALAEKGVAVRAGLHCAPLAHESAGTIDTGVVRVSFGHDGSEKQNGEFLRAVSKLPRFAE